MKFLVLVALLGPAAALAGPYDQPYAIITTDTAPSADALLRPVIVNRVDGETVAGAGNNKAVVAPGTRKLTLDLPPRKGFRVSTQRTLDLVARPCMRYYVVARLDTAVGQEWQPVVRSSELIAECQKAFKDSDIK